MAPVVTRWIERLLAAHDPPLTVQQYLALRAISEEVGSAAELARRAGISGPAASQLLAGLETAGLIQRGPAADDRRRHLLILSPAGQRVHRAAARRLHSGIGALVAELPPPDADALARALPAVAALLAGTAPPRRRPPPPPPAHGHRRRP